MHREWLNVGAELVEKIRRTRDAAAAAIVAVGTTVVRALETATRDGVLQPFAGETQIFIFPGYRITRVDALVTNFHLPESTLLMLVSRIRRARGDARGVSSRGRAALSLFLATAMRC